MENVCVPMVNSDAGGFLENLNVEIPALEGSDAKDVDVPVIVIPELCNDVSELGVSEPDEA